MYLEYKAAYAAGIPGAPTHDRVAYGPEGYRAEVWKDGKLVSSGPFRRSREKAIGDLPKYPDYDWSKPGGGR